MKRFLLVILTNIFFFSFSCTEQGFSQTGVQFWGDTLCITTFTHVYEHYDKGLFFTGSHENYTLNSNYGFIRKTDINNNLLWQKLFGNAGEEYIFNSSALLSNNSCLAGGGINQNYVVKPLLSKINPCGEKEWCRIYNAPGDNSGCSDIVAFNDSIYYLSINGWYNSSQQLLLKIDENGEVIWSKFFATNSDIF